ncbi:MAG: hypothetical protein ACP5NS_04120 [Candidatus Pacearchaeota archaeon]
MKVLTELHNSLLHRKDVILMKSFDSNPGKEAVKQAVAEHYKTSPDCVVVLGIHGGFGMSVFRIEARVYDSADKMTLVEPKPKVKKVAA